MERKRNVEKTISEEEQKLEIKASNKMDSKHSKQSENQSNFTNQEHDLKISNNLQPLPSDNIDLSLNIQE